MRCAAGGLLTLSPASDQIIDLSELLIDRAKYSAVLLTKVSHLDLDIRQHCLDFGQANGSPRSYGVLPDGYL